MKLMFPYGLNENDDARPDEAYLGSYNFELQLNKHDFQPRKPIDLKATTANAGDIRGIMQLVKRDDTTTTLIQSDDIVYSWDGSSFTTEGACNVSSKLRGTYWSLDDYLIITDLNKATELQQWDGTTFKTQGTGLINPFAKYAAVWNNRVWLFNLTENGVDLSHAIVASAFEDPTSFTTGTRAQSAGITGNEAFYILAPDLRPINGVAVFRNQILFSTEDGRIYRITGTDATDYAITSFYSGSAAIGDESLANVGNDVMYMKRGGVVESLIATDTFGDVGADDLSRWIPTTRKDLLGSLTVYDQNNQKVYFFVSNKVLVLFKDILPSGRSPWSVYKTTLTNAFNASSAMYMRRPGTTTYSVYWGDNSGNIYDMDGSGAGGDGGTDDIFSIRKTYYLDQNDLGVSYRNYPLIGRINYIRVYEVEAVLTFDWGDTYHSPTTTIKLKGVPTGDTGVYYGGAFYYGGSHYYGEGFTFVNRVSSRGFSPTGRGEGFTLSVEVNAKRTFQIRDIEIPAI
jgi:hypothetical protein